MASLRATPWPRNSCTSVVPYWPVIEHLRRAGFSAAFIDREVETKGLDLIDKERAKREAEQQVVPQLSNDY
jgi:hypothetical protein